LNLIYAVTINLLHSQVYKNIFIGAFIIFHCQNLWTTGSRLELSSHKRKTSVYWEVVSSLFALFGFAWRTLHTKPNNAFLRSIDHVLSLILQLHLLEFDSTVSFYCLWTPAVILCMAIQARPIACGILNVCLNSCRQFVMCLVYISHLPLVLLSTDSD
jgi:hypothetical protein